MQNPTGCYRRTFLVNQSWLAPNKRVVLIFEGVCSAFEVWVNGRWLGCSKDSCLPAEFDITEALQLAPDVTLTHVVAMRVMQWSDATYLEDQDQWWLSGVTRDVTLQCRPRLGLLDYRLQTTINWRSPNPRNLKVAGAELELEVELAEALVASLLPLPGVERDKDEAREYCLEAQLLGPYCQSYSPSSSSSSSTTSSSSASVSSFSSLTSSAMSRVDPTTPVASSRLNLDEESVSEGGIAMIKLQVPAQDVVLWTAETPSLYRLTLTLLSAPAGIASYTATGSAGKGIKGIAGLPGMSGVGGERVYARSIQRHGSFFGPSGSISGGNAATTRTRGACL